MTMLIVTGYIHLAVHDVGAFVDDMATFAPAACARDGCLFFAVAPEEAATGPMLVAERWRDQAALDAHLAAEDTVAFVSRWGGRMGSDLAKFDASNQQPLLAPETSSANGRFEAEGFRLQDHPLSTQRGTSSQFA